VAERKLLFERYLAHRPVLPLGDDMRVVTESQRSASLEHDAPLARSFRDELRSARDDEYGDAPVPAGARGIGYIRKLRHELGVVLFVGSAFSRVACRENAGPAPQGVHLEPRIVGYRREPGRGDHRPSLRERVLSERIEWFFELEGGREQVKRNELYLR
jgi:hypothetical protein